MNDTEQVILDSVGLDDPWALVETFAGLKREHPREPGHGRSGEPTGKTRRAGQNAQRQPLS